jgi:microsomal dipeptidase-like Zn-dependent dipeptidase
MLQGVNKNSLRPLPVTKSKRNISPEEAESKAKKERMQKRRIMLNSMVKNAINAVKMTTPMPLISKSAKTIAKITKEVARKLNDRDKYRKESIEKMIKEEKLERAMAMKDFDYIEKNYNKK